MPHDQLLVDRVRVLVARRRDVSERKMFGGVCFMVAGNMACGVAEKDLVVRLGAAGATAALEERHTRPMDFTGRPMKSMVYVGPAGLRSEGSLKSWVDRSVRFARSLPPKKPTS